jgi:tetratricopeptide (TPR) repeat protein
MKQVEAESYNIAWFKLADCIARGEKERALGVYRLLSHSLDDSALACQLLGDILRSFQDERALKKYEEAAELYRSQNRVIEAAAVYEHLRSLDPEQKEYRLQLIELYQQLAIRSKVTHYVADLITLLLVNNEWHQAIEMVLRYETAGDVAFCARLHEQLLFHLAATKEVLPDTAMVHAKKAIDAWAECNDIKAIAQLLSRLESINKKVAQHAQTYWQERK